MSDDVVIRIEGLWKSYGLRVPRTIERGINWLSQIRNSCLRPGLQAKQAVASTSRQGGPQSEVRNINGGPWALRDINLEVKRGETLGIIGRNGAGKSTLLKVLAGVTPPTRGRMEVCGRVFPMIELNAGLHVELTGRENVRLLAAIIGFSRGEIEAKMLEIEEFCELEEWFDRPVRMYSSGMLARLGFAVGVNVDADILLVDEVLGVGDLGFYNKCLRHMERMHSAGGSFLLVSHNMRHASRVCDQVMVLEKGGVVFSGHPEEAIDHYEEILRTIEAGRQSGRESFDFVGVRLEQVQLIASNGEPTDVVSPGEEVAIEFSLMIDQRLEQVTLNVVVESIEAIPVVWESLDVPYLEPGRHHFCVRWHDLRLKAGPYSVRIGMGVGCFPLKGFRVTNALQLRMEGDALDRGLYVPSSDFIHEFDGPA